MYSNKVCNVNNICTDKIKYDHLENQNVQVGQVIHLDSGVHVQRYNIPGRDNYETKPDLTEKINQTSSVPEIINETEKQNSVSATPEKSQVKIKP